LSRLLILTCQGLIRLGLRRKPVHAILELTTTDWCDMARRKQLHVSRWGTPPDNERWFDSAKINNRNVEFGTQLTFKGRKGVYSFIQYRECDDGDDVLDVFVVTGARTGQFKQFPVADVRAVKRQPVRARS
jgi:hypothetical protein